MPLPTTNITTTIVRNELGAATNNVGELCTHPNVNMFARKKPVRVPGTPANWYEADNFGISVPSWVRGTEQYWTYNKPRGGVNEPYRLGDFRGYEHSAGNPILLQNNNGKVYNLIASDTITLSAIVAALPNNLAITYYDVLPNHFFAVEVESSAGTRYWRTTLTGSISIDFSTPPFSYNEWKTGNIILRFFFSVKEKTTFTSTDVTGEQRRALHSEALRPTNQTISTKMAASVECDITGVATELQPSSWSDGVSEFPEVGQTQPGPRQGVLISKVAYGLALKCKFKSKEDFNIQLSQNDLSFGVSSNWHNVSYYPSGYGRFYDLNGNAITTLLTTPGAWTDEVIFFSEGVFNWNGTGTSAPPNTNPKNVTLSIRQHGLNQTYTLDTVLKWIL